MDEQEQLEPSEENLIVGPVDTGATCVLLMPTMYNYEPHCFSSVFEASRRFGMNRLRFADPVIKTCIWKARDRMAHIFLNQYDAEYCLFVDADQGIPTGNVDRWRARFGTTLPDRFGKINAIEHILSHGPQYGIIGGVYFDRIKGRSIMCKDGCGDRRNQVFIDKVRTGAQRGLVKQDWVATGFMRIHRRVFEKLIANINRFPEMRPSKAGNPYGFFMPYIQGGHSQIGEDSAFCFPPGTWVYGRKVKKIEDIKPGDMVLNSVCGMKRVESCGSRHYSGDMIRITSCYLGQVEATPQHKFLVRRTAPSNRVANFVGFDGIKRDVVIHHREKQWVEAKDVKKGDWIYVPKPSAINREGENVIHLSHYACVKSPGLSLGSDGMWRYSRTRKSAIPISDKIGITPELCRFIGYYLAEGYTSNNASMLSLCFNENESEYINECVSVLKDVFGASPTVRKAPGARIINVSSKLLCRLMNGLCGNGADSKHLPRLWDKLSSANLSEIIRGYWRGDGNFSVKRFNAVTVSERLSREIQSALLKLHILCGVSTTFDKDGRVRYNMSIPSRLANRMEAIVGFGVGHVDVKETKAYMRETKRHFLVSVKECEVFQYSGLVYNLKMNGDPSYTANLHGVHNCLRAGQVGEPSYLDTDIRLFHCGSVWH